MRADRNKPLHRYAAACVSAVLLCAFYSDTACLAQTIRPDPAGRLEQERQFDIPAQPLATALLAFSRQADVQVVTSSIELGMLRTAGVHGITQARRALAKLLENSGLEFSVIGSDTIVIRPMAKVSAERSSWLASARAGAAQFEAGSGDATNALPRQNAAANRSGDALEEIMVTARKRAENLQATPLAVTAFTAEALQLRHVDTIDQVAQFVPNLQFDGAAALSGASFNSTIFIRGIGQNDFATFSEPGVGIYLDGVYLGRTIGSTLLALDLARLEVLRGPQGSLFGRNTIGGAINIISQPPGDTLQFDSSLTLGSLRRRDVKAMANVPLADGKLLTRWSLAAVNRDGYARQIDYLTGEAQERGDQNTLAGRVQTLWHPNERVDVALQLDGTRTRQHAAPLTLVRVTPPGDPYLSIFNSQVAPGLSIVAPDGSTGITDAWITGDPYATYGEFGNFNDLDNWGAALTVDAAPGSAHIKSITAYRYLSAAFGRDGDNSPYVYRETFNTDTQWQVSQEFQLAGLSLQDRLHWLAGLYYFEEDTLDHGGARLAVGVYDVTGNPEQDLDILLHNINTTRSYAAFAQATLQLTDRFSISPGLRFTRDQKRFSGYQSRLGTAQYIVPPGFRKQASWNEFSPKLSLELQVTRQSLLYLSASNGYKSGGFNERPLRSILDVNEYSPERVWSYEAGAKTSWLEHRLIFNANVFYNDYQDIQLTVNATPQNFVANAAAGRIVGAEAELTARVSAGFDVNASAGYLDTRYTELRPCREFDAAGALCLPITLDTTFVKAPQWTLSCGAQYTLQLPTLGSLVLRGDWSYKSLTYHDVGNDAAIAQPGYGVANAGILFAGAAGHLELSAFVRNLGDKRYRISGNASSAQLGGLAESTFAAPREWSVTLTYKL